MHAAGESTSNHMPHRTESIQSTTRRKAPAGADGKALWSVERGRSPIVATAIHDGHALRPDIAGQYALTSDSRLREEDPFTAFLISDMTNQVVFHRSRFEVDLNRARDAAVYLRPDQAWGLEVWKTPLRPEQLDASLRVHDDYYRMLATMLAGIQQDHGQFVLLDMHSYNHRRGGHDQRPTDQKDAPDINIGTSSMKRELWGDVIDALVTHFSRFTLNGRALDVRENIAFQGRGEQTRFVHQEFPETGCAIAIEFKKIFMDEWTGEPDRAALVQLRSIVASAEPLLERLLEGRS